MNVDRERSWGRGMTGALLIGLGVIFLLMNFGMWHYGSIGRWWPVIFFVLAAGKLARWTPYQVGGAIMFIVLGLWFFACQSEWHGMTYLNSWPILLVGSGFDMLLTGVLIALARRSRRERGEESDHA